MRLLTEEYYVNGIIISTFYPFRSNLSWELHITSYQPSRNKHPSSSVALQPGVGLGLLYNKLPSLIIPCSVSPFVYSHLSQVREHGIQPSHFWSSSSSCCIQLSVHLFSNCGVLHSFYMTKPSYFWHLMNLTMFSPLIIASNSSFRQILHNSFSFTVPYIFQSIFLSNTPNALSSSTVSVHDCEP